VDEFEPDLLMPVAALAWPAPEKAGLQPCPLASAALYRSLISAYL